MKQQDAHDFKRGNVKVLSSIVVILVLIVGFSACERLPQTLQPVKAKGLEIRVGVVLPLTGSWRLQQRS